MAAAGWGAGAAAAAGVHQAFINAKATTDAAKFQVQFASDTNVINRTREDNRLQRARADAEAAGLHPLFALGSAGAGSASISMSPTPTGTAAGTGLQRAGEAIQRGISEYGKQKRTTRLDAAAAELHALAVQSAKGKIHLDELEAQRRASDLAVSTQRQFWGGSDSGMDSNYGQTGPRLVPYTTRAGLPLESRPLEEYPRQSIPLRKEVIGDDGYRYRPISSEAGDELSWVDLFQQMVMRHVRKARKAPGRELKIQFERAARLMAGRHRGRKIQKRRRRQMRNQLRAQSRYGR